MSATRFNVGAGNREFTAVALHNDAYRAVIKAFDDSVERINFEKRYFMSRFKQHLESYKRRFVALHENQRDPEYLNNLQQLCKEIQLAFNQQKKVCEWFICACCRSRGTRNFDSCVNNFFGFSGSGLSFCRLWCNDG